MIEPTDLMNQLAQEVMDELGVTDKEYAQIEKAHADYFDESTYEKMSFVYYGEPKAQARARAVSNLSHFYDPSKSFKQYINEQVRHQLGNNFKPISKEIYFTARYYRTTPKGESRVNKILAEMGVFRPLKKPDLDNYEKLFYDALHGLLYTDDSVVIKGNHEKFYSCKPRVEVDILFKK
jgi:Holliday junction resolvase RusA-like endonuclease